MDVGLTERVDGDERLGCLSDCAAVQRGPSEAARCARQGLRTKLGAFSQPSRLDGDVHKRRHTIRPLLIRHPQLEPVGAFL